MILLLDTNVLIDVLRADRLVREILAGQVESGHTLATSAINIAEVYAGMRPAESAKTEALISAITCYEVTPAIARRAGTIKYDFARKGQTLSLADMIIAATALEHGLTLMTENVRDFPVPGLTLLPS